MYKTRLYNRHGLVVSVGEGFCGHIGGCKYIFKLNHRIEMFSNYLRQGGYVFGPVCLFVRFFVSLFVCLSVNMISQEVMEGFS